MSFLKNLEQEYVLGDIKLFHEFDSSHFISNSKMAVTNKAQTVKLNMKFDYYSSMLEKAIESFNNIKLDKNATNAILSNIDKIDGKGIVAKDLKYSNVATFKPQYLNQYINLIGEAIDKVIRGTIDQNTFVTFINGELPLKVSKQVVKTSLPYGMNSKVLLKEEDNVSNITIDSKYVKNNIVPFINSFNNIKNETLTEANAVLNSIKETEDSVHGMLTVINNYINSGSTDIIDTKTIRQLNQLSYNSIRGIIEVVSFVTFVMIRKLNTISSFIINCEEIAINFENSMSINESFNDMIIPTDSHSLADSLISGESDAYRTLASNIYDFHSGMPQSELISKLDFNNKYDKTPYEEVIKMYTIISRGLDIIAAKVSDNFLMIFDDIIEKAGFTVRLQDRFRNIPEIVSDVNKYNSAVNISVPDSFDYDIYGEMMQEVNEYGDNMDAIAKSILETKSKMDILIKKFESNVNGEFSDSEAINELKIFMQDLDEQFTTLTNNIASAFMGRLKDIGDDLTKVESIGKSIDTIDNPNVDNSNDYVESAFDEELSELEESTKNVFRMLEESYYAEKELALRGVNVIFEADNTQTNTGTQNGDNSQTPNNTNTNNNNTSPTLVQDNSQNNTTNNQNQTNSDTNNKPMSNITEWINKKINEFIEFITKQGDKKNKKWIAENKEELLGRSYNNVAIKILPYNNMSVDSIINDIGTLTKNIKALTPQAIQGLNSNTDVYTKLFSFISGLKVNDTNISDQFKNYYKTKTTTQSEVITIANTNLKNFVTSDMIPYCERYYNDFGNSGSSTLKAAFDELGKSLDTVINNCNTMTESVVFTEADTDDANKNTKGSMTEKGRWIQVAVRYFIGAIMNALRDRVNDYLKTLNLLVPKNSKAPKDNNIKNNTANNNNNVNNNI